MSRKTKDANRATNTPSVDYEIGYGRPPEATRFKPGNQAAAKGGGRPKGRKNDATIVKAVVNHKVTVTLPNGVKKKMTIWEAGFWKLAIKSANGDPKAWTEFNRMAELYGVVVPTPAPIDEFVSEGEEEMMERHFAGWARAYPERASELLRQLSPSLPSPSATPTVPTVEGRPTVRRVNFALAEGTPPLTRGKRNASSSLSPRGAS